MDAKSQLRRYLEQRRELGESEFLLDNMSVEEALQTLGVIRRGGGTRRAVAATTGEGEEGAAPQSVAPSVPPAQTAPAPISSPQPLAPIVAQRTSVSQEPARRDVEETGAKQPVSNIHISSRAEGSDDMARIKGNVVRASDVDVPAGENPFKHLASIGAIAKEVEQCTRCILYKTATHGVPGEGNVHADLVCVGEAPGANEDATGRPFVGAAGQLLTKILAAVDIKREDVFICNVLKHRPPGNRNPLPEEVAACSPYLTRQIEIIRPKVILAFGTFAAQTLLATKTPIGKLRGEVHTYHGVPLVVTYHPAALLRNPAWKRPTWEDVKLARRVLDNAK